MIISLIILLVGIVLLVFAMPLSGYYNAWTTRLRARPNTRNAHAQYSYLRVAVTSSWSKFYLPRRNPSTGSYAVKQLHTIRMELPLHLTRLANLSGHVTTLEVAAPVTLCVVLDELERRYPALQGTMRDHVTHKRRDFLRFFVCQEDWSHRSPDEPLPEAIVSGKEPLLVIGAIAGG